MEKPILFTKLCNAFFPDAEIDRDVLSGAATHAVDRYKRKHGGIWVGGKVLVRHDDIQFVPNGINMALHTNIEDVLVPFASVRSVMWEFGVLTGIVVLQCDRFDFRFRCFGAKGTVKQLTALVNSRNSSRLMDANLPTTQHVSIPTDE